MRPAHAAFATLAIAAIAVAVAMGSRFVVPEVPDAPSDGAAREGPDTAAIPKARPPKAPVRSRAIAPDFVALPDLDIGELERVEPRPPLSELALAQPPKPTMPDEWDGTRLFRPLAVESGVFEAMGYKVAIAGVKSVAPDETCSADGVEWACGARARGAVRMWLRGRALVCAVPPEADRTIIVAACRLGKQDVGAWLVSNGWARATETGPYVKAQEVARMARMGIFGPPPDLSNLPPAPAPGDSLLAAPLEPLTPPTGRPAPLQ
jgi:endonuclease YncB( thermonuclease family)